MAGKKTYRPKSCDEGHTKNRPIIGMGVPYVRFRLANVRPPWYNGTRNRETSPSLETKGK